MHPHVGFTLPSCELVDLRPGDIIGRSDRAALCLNEPYISEAHAMVSLRSGELKLLAMRGRFSVDGRPASQVTLVPGQRIVLASRVALLVARVEVPSEVLAIAVEGVAPMVLAAVCSLTLTPAPELVAGFVPEAAAVFWTSGARLFARVEDGPTRGLVPGDRLEVGGRAFAVVALPFVGPSHAPTQESHELGAPLHLVLNYDTVHLTTGSERLTLEGISARILSELAAVRAPLAWQEVARQIWGRDPISEAALRERWDSSLARLRRKLSAARLRTDLVHTTGSGLVEILLGPGDTMEDRM